MLENLGEQGARIISAIGTSVGGLILAYAVLVKNRAGAKRFPVLLSRTWDILHSRRGRDLEPDATIAEQMPPNLRAEVETALSDSGDE